MINNVGLIIPVLSVVIGWMLNEYAKRNYDNFKNKEQRYEKLITALQGFYANSLNAEVKATFINQLNLCWMYCPDTVILQGYAFLNTVHTESKSGENERYLAVGEFIYAIRKDILRKNILERVFCRKYKLTAKEFRHYSAGNTHPAPL
jgi:hypothetical protein